MLRRVLQNKGRPGYSVSPDGSTSIKLNKGDHWINIVRPGNTGQKDTVSLQIIDGRWIVQRSLTVFHILPYRNEDWFNNASTFLIYQNKWFDGTVALESNINRNFFLMFTDNSFTIRMKRKYYIADKKWSSWIIYDQSKF